MRRSVRALQTLTKLMVHGGMRPKDTNERSANTLHRQDVHFNNADGSHIITAVPLEKFARTFQTIL